jgi:hypothetical protein
MAFLLLAPLFSTGLDGTPIVLTVVMLLLLLPLLLGVVMPPLVETVTPLGYCG